MTNSALLSFMNWYIYFFTVITLFTISRTYFRFSMKLSNMVLPPSPFPIYLPYLIISSLYSSSIFSSPLSKTSIWFPLLLDQFSHFLLPIFIAFSLRFPHSSHSKYISCMSNDYLLENVSILHPPPSVFLLSKFLHLSAFYPRKPFDISMLNSLFLYSFNRLCYICPYVYEFESTIGLPLKFRFGHHKIKVRLTSWHVPQEIFFTLPCWLARSHWGIYLIWPH